MLFCAGETLHIVAEGTVAERLATPEFKVQWNLISSKKVVRDLLGVVLGVVRQSLLLLTAG